MEHLENHMYQIAPEYFEQFQTTARWCYTHALLHIVWQLETIYLKLIKLLDLNQQKFESVE